MKVKIWYTLQEGGHWKETEIESTIFKHGCMSFTPAICIDESLLPPGVDRERSKVRFYLGGIDFPIFAFTLVDPISKEYVRNRDVYDATLMLSPDVHSIITRNMLRNYKLIPWEDKVNEKETPEETE